MYNNRLISFFIASGAQFVIICKYNCNEYKIKEVPKLPLFSELFLIVETSMENFDCADRVAICLSFHKYPGTWTSTALSTNTWQIQVGLIYILIAHSFRVS